MAPPPAAWRALPQAQTDDPSDAGGAPTSSYGLGDFLPPANDQGAAPAYSLGDFLPDQPSERGAVARFGAGAAQGIVSGLGESMKGTAELVAAPQTLQRGALAPYYQAYQDYAGMTQEQRNAVHKQIAADPNLTLVDRARLEHSLATRAHGAPALPQDEWTPAPEPEKSGLYHAGEAVSGAAEKMFPMTDAEKQTWSGTIGRGVGSAVPAVGLGVLGAFVGAPEIGLIGGAAQMGTMGAAQQHEAAAAKGASPEATAKATLLGGTTGAGLGATDLGVVLAPVERLAPGIWPWAAAKLQQAVRGGVTFTGLGEAQEWISQEIAKHFYDPNAGYAPDIKRLLSSFATGALLAPTAPTSLRPEPDFSRPPEAPAPGTAAPPPETPPPGGPTPRAAEPPVSGAAAELAAYAAQPRPAEPATQAPRGLFGLRRWTEPAAEAAQPGTAVSLRPTEPTPPAAEPEPTPPVASAPTRIRPLDQIMREDGVTSAKAQQIQNAEILALGTPITPQDVINHRLGVQAQPPARAAPPLQPPSPPPATEAQPPGGYATFAPGALTVLPEQMQFKASDAKGVTGALTGVNVWEPALANPITVWVNNAGQNVVVNGHQRVDLATRAEAAGQQDIMIPARVFHESDGYTPDYMRALGAYQNIAEGSGTAIDAAKVLRTQNAFPDSLRLPELPPKQMIVQQARGLAALSDDAFGAVEHGLVPPEYAGMVGAVIADPAEQMAALDVLSRAQPANANQARIMIADIRSSGFLQGAQTTLFGDEAFSRSLVPERAKVLDAAMRQLRRAKEAFNATVKSEDTLAAAGNKLATQANIEGKSASERLLETIGRNATTRGPYSDALNVAARDLAAGKPIRGVTNAFLATARELERGGAHPGVPAGAPEHGVGPAAEGEAGPITDENQSPLFGRRGQGLQELLNELRQPPKGTDRRQTELLFPETPKSMAPPPRAKSPAPGAIGGNMAVDFMSFAHRNPGVPATRLAAQYVIEQGLATGHEFMTAYDPATDSVALAHTSGKVNAVQFPPEFLAMISDPTRAVVLHHNHPSGSSLSSTDIIGLAYPGLASVVAHGHNGEMYAAALGPALARIAQPALIANTIHRLELRARNSAISGLSRAVFDGEAIRAELEAVSNDTIMRTLHRLGIIDYVATVKLPPHVAAIADRVINQTLTGGASVGADRPPVGVSHDEGATRIVARAAELARARRSAGQAGGGGGALVSAAAGENAHGAAQEAGLRGVEERKPPLPRATGAPLFGEAEKPPAPARVPEPTIRNDERQAVMPGMGPSAVQAQAARDQAGRGALTAAGEQKKADEGLFAPKAPEQKPLFGRGVRPITAFHGSPHDFDRFDVSKIGTGEGAQAYGHGLYFAEREAVARDYRDTLARRQGWTRIAGDKEPENTAPPGHMYQTALHLDPDKTLDWGRPFAQQPKAVQEALRKIPRASPFVRGLASARDAIPRTAESARQMLDAGIEGIRYLDAGSRALPGLSDKGLAEYFKPGELVQGYGGHWDRVVQFHPGRNWSVDVREVDRNGNEGPLRNHSTLPTDREIATAELRRGTTFDRPEGTRNYVVFDDKLIDIERKYGRHGLQPADAAVAYPKPEAIQALLDAAQRMTGGHVQIEGYDANHHVFTVRFPDGSREQVFGYVIGRILRAAIAGEDETAWHLNHETLHALRGLGLFTAPEWRTLEQTAERENWIGQYNIEKFYPNLDRARQLEEAIAERMADRNTDKTAHPNLARIMAKIRQFFARVRNMLRGNGFRTADDVFEAVQRGDVGARDPGAGPLPSRHETAPTMEESEQGLRAFEQAQGMMESGVSFARGPRRQRALAVTPEPPKGLRKAMDQIRSWFAPAGRTPRSQQMEHLIRRASAERAQASEQSLDRLETFRHDLNRLPVLQRLEFWDRAERGQPQPVPGLDLVAHALRNNLDYWRDMIQQLGRVIDRPLLDHAIEHYMGRQYSNHDEWARGLVPGTPPAQALAAARAATASKRPLRGRAGFLKEREYEFLSDAMADGLIPVTTNPVDMQLIKLREMQQFFYGTLLAERIKRAGLAQWVPYHEDAAARRDGLVKLDDAVFQPVLRSEAEYGARTVGGWYAEEPVARVFNNYVSRGLYGQSIVYDAFRNVGNGLNMAQLGLSGFHATFVAIDALTSTTALGVHQIGRGLRKAATGKPGAVADLARGAGNIALGSPVAIPYTVPALVAKGARLRRFMLIGADELPPGAKPIVEALLTGGGRIRMGGFHSADQQGAFIKNMRDLRRVITNPMDLPREIADMFRQHPFSAPYHIAMRLIQQTTEPLMGHLVPLAKLGVFSNLAEDFMREHPSATTQADQAEFMTKAWDSVENRLGQMTYDNVFWKKWMKDMAFILVRSVGWNLGTARELAGAPVDLVANTMRRLKGQPSKESLRVGYAIALPLLTAQIGAIVTYLTTGAAPTSTLDYFYPPDGHGGRLTIPGYMKDVIAAWHDLPQTVLNKLHPLFSIIPQLKQNRDYYGAIIDMPGVDNPVTAYGSFLLGQAVPFSIRGMMRQATTGGDMSDAALSFWGFQPAPAWITNPEQGEAFQRRDDIKAYRRRLRLEQRGVIP